MTLRAASAALGLALVVAAGAFAALAQDAPAPDGQTPPVEQKPAEKPSCIVSDAGFKTRGKAATFEVELVNSCNKRVKCTVDAFVTGARGQAQGHGTLILAAAPKGQTTRKTYVLKVKSPGGMAQTAHSCKAI